MNDAIAIKNMVLAALAAAGSVVANQLGGWDAALCLLIMLMAADYLTGVVVAAVFKNSNKTESGALSSKAGFVGLLKKCTILIMIWIATQLDAAMGANYIRMALILFYVGNEGLSLLENIGLMGVPYPAFLKNTLDALKDKGNGGEQNDTH